MLNLLAPNTTRHFSFFSSILTTIRGQTPKVTTRWVSKVHAEFDVDPKELGSGRFGVVKIGTRRSDGETLAVKIVPKTYITELKNEIKCLRKVQGHRNVMNLLDAFEDRTSVYVLTPLYTGGELFDRIASKGHFSERDAMRVMNDILGGLAHCHERRVVHRDLKPENLLYQSSAPGSDLVLVDFGMAREFAGGETMSMQCGSPSYVAPEVLEGRYTEKCDTWSAGIILHILLCGSTPFGNTETDDQTLSLVEKFNGPKFEGREWDLVSNEAKDLVEKLLKRNPSERPSPKIALGHRWLTEDPDRPTVVLNHALENMKEFNRYRRLKKAAIRFISELARDEGEAKRFSEMLATVHRDDMGRIRSSDLASIIPVPRELISASGTVDPNELVASALTRSIYLDEKYLLAAFKKFDHDSNGIIDSAELRSALGDGVDASLVEEAMRHADTDGSGGITFEEFIRVIREKSPEIAKKRELTMSR